MASKGVGPAAVCIETINHPKIRVSDPGTGKSAILLNPDRGRARRIRMDGCLAPAGSVAADWIVSKPAVVDVIVELKGSNVDHAVEQIEATLRFWVRHVEYQEGQQIGAWIICSEFPRASLRANRYRESFRAGGRILLISTHNSEERPFSDFVPRRA
jgi:hypothetical protein